MDWRIWRTSAAISPTATTSNSGPTDPLILPAGGGPSALHRTGRLGALRMRRSGTAPAAQVPHQAPPPQVSTGRSRGSHQPRVSVSGDDRRVAKALRRHVLGRHCGLQEVSLPQPQPDGAALQYGRTTAGTAVQLNMGPAATSAIASCEAVYACAPPPPAASPAKRLARRLKDLLPRRSTTLAAKPGELDSGLGQVPSHMVSSIASTSDGTSFGIGPDSRLYRFENERQAWEPAGEAGWDYAHLGPQPDGRLYAARTLPEGGSQIVRIDAGGPQPVHASDGPVASYAVTASGALLVLDHEGDLTRAQGDRLTRGPVVLQNQGARQDAAGGPPRPRPAAIGVAADGQCFIAGDDGRMYRMTHSTAPGPQGFTAQPVVTPFSDPDDPAHQASLLDLGHTFDPLTRRATLHALYRKPTGEVFSAHYEPGAGFKPGWRFDNAFVTINRRGMEPVRIPPEDVVTVNRDGLQAGVRRGRLFVRAAGESWQSTALTDVARVKVNPLGLDKTYALQSVAQPDGSVHKRLVRLDINGWHQPLPAGPAPRLGSVADAADVQATVLAQGPIRDYAVLESLGTHPGDRTRTLYYVDDANRLFVRDLNADAPARQLPANDIGTLRELALDSSGVLHALAARDGEPAALYRYDGSRHPAWQPQKVPLAPGSELAGLAATAAGQLHVRVAASPAGGSAACGPAGAADAPHEVRTYRFHPRTGLAPLDRRSARDAIAAAGEMTFHLPGLPEGRVRHEWLGFHSTSRMFLSSTVNWFQSSWAHARGLKSAPKVALRWLQHKRHGREGLQPLYSSAADAGGYGERCVATGRPQAPDRLARRLRHIGWRTPELADAMRHTAETLLKDCRQTLEHIAHAQGFLDANHAPDPGFKSRRPRDFKASRDLVAGLRGWFEGFHASGWPAAGTPGDSAAITDLLRRMSDNPQRLYMPHLPSDPAEVRRTGDAHGLLTARLLRNMQALAQLETLAADALDEHEDPLQQLRALEAARAADPVVRYTDLSLHDIGTAEDIYDIFRSFSKALNNWRHPLNRTVAQSLGVTEPGRRKSELLQQAQAALKGKAPLDPNLLARYGLRDAAELRRVLTDKEHPRHGTIHDQLRAESLEELRSRFAELVTGLAPKEQFATGRRYGTGIDPLGYINNLAGAFVFLGGMLQRDYQVSVEAIGDATEGADLFFLIEKGREASVEAAAGWGTSPGMRGSGVLDHLMRVAAFGGVDAARAQAASMYFAVPRDKVRTFTDRLFDFGSRGSAGPKDLHELLSPCYERETIRSKTHSFELGAQAFVRMGPNQYDEAAGGHFWAARPSLFHGTASIGHESNTMKMHGRSHDGGLQTGTERHDYLTQRAQVQMPGLRFRSWFNFPSDASAEHQLALGVGNTDNEISFGVRNKDGIYSDYRAAVPAPVQPAQWRSLLAEAGAAFPAQRAGLARMADWADDAAAFGPRLAAWRDEVQQWPGDAGMRAELLASLDRMRWQHALAVAKKPMISSMIYELRPHNSARLTRPALLDRLPGAAGQANRPLSDLYRRLKADPTLRQLIHDLQATHPTRLKIRYQITPEAMDRLVRMQLDNPNLSQERLSEFLHDPANFRLANIAALREARASNGASIWPVIGATSSTATSSERVAGILRFQYDANGHDTGYLIDGAFARKRRSVANSRQAFNGLQHEPAVMPRQYGPGPAGRAAAEAAQNARLDRLAGEDDADDEFFEARMILEEEQVHP